MTAYEALQSMNDEYNELLERFGLTGGFGNWYIIVKKALNELEELKKEVVQRQETEDSLTAWVGELTEKPDQYKPPTVEEICKMLEPYYGNVQYAEDSKSFYIDTISGMVFIARQRLYGVSLTYDLKPSILVALGLFYNSIEKGE